MEPQRLFLQAIRILEQLKIPYMVTGSWAVNFYAEPRTTHDIDFIVEIHPADAGKLAAAFPAEYYADAGMIREAIRSQTMFNVIDPSSGGKLDFWIVTSTPFDQERFRRRRLQSFFGQPVFMPTPEDVILAKLLWYQEAQTDKHLHDLQNIWAVQKPMLDQAYLGRWVNRLGLQTEFEKMKRASHLE